MVVPGGDELAYRPGPLSIIPRGLRPIPARAQNKQELLQPRPTQHSRLVSPRRGLERDHLPPRWSAATLGDVGGGRAGGSLARAAELARLEGRLGSRDDAGGAGPG